MQRPSNSTPRPALVADVAIKLATIGLLVWAVLSPDLPQFQGKAFAGRAIAYPVALLIVPICWWLVGRRRIAFPVAADILFGLPFLIDVAGNALDLYDTIEWWDDANHLVNWALHTAAVGLLLRYGQWTPATRVALAFGYAVTTTVLWELAEFVTFVPNSREAATAYADTLLDLALGVVGGLVGAIVTSRLPLVGGARAGLSRPRGQSGPSIRPSLVRRLFGAMEYGSGDTRTQEVRTMANYLLVYRGGSMPETPDEQGKVMQAWNDWFGQLGSALVDGGNPASQTKVIGADGSVSPGGAGSPSGYSVIAADDIDSAVRLAKGCPVLAGGATVDVVETFAAM